MSKPQKLKKTKKTMSPEAKAAISNSFRGIISNQACVDGGKDSPWWIALIFLCVSIILPLIPVMVQQSKMYGAQPFSSLIYEGDRGIRNTLKDAKDEGYNFRIENGLMSFYQNESEASFLNDPEQPLEQDLIALDSSTTIINFSLYITDKKGNDLVDFVTKVSQRKFENNSMIPYDPEQAEHYAEEGTTFYTPSFMVLAPETLGVGLYKKATTVLAASSYGGLNWNHMPELSTKENDFINFVLVEVGGEITETMSLKGTFDNFRNVMNNTFTDQKNISFRNNVLIYFGVYAGLILFLGLMVFILTRGKNNIFNFLSFFKCQRITWWAAFTPALLGMVAALIFPGNMIGQMAFVVLLSLRVMWLSMKQLRPVQ